MEIYVDSPAGLDKAVKKLLAFAGKRKTFAFSGDIGAGKTTFIQAFCRHFGVEEAVTSPTFSLVNEYVYQDPEGGGEGVIFHLDLYRLKDIDEALNIGIEEILDADAYKLIEWPELIEPLLPEDAVRINMEIVENSRRKILFL
jgi:tRNA threonylcarbamoyladenosine biosynthesis protein TsaE